MMKYIKRIAACIFAAALVCSLGLLVACGGGNSLSFTRGKTLPLSVAACRSSYRRRSGELRAAIYSERRLVDISFTASDKRRGVLCLLSYRHFVCAFVRRDFALASKQRFLYFLHNLRRISVARLLGVRGYKPFCACSAVGGVLVSIRA